MDENGIIGDSHTNETPWGRGLKDDLEHFRKTTIDKTVILGRKTAESIFREIGKPLPRRRNIILSRDRNFRLVGCEVFADPLHVLDVIRRDELWVIGGSEIYRAFAPHVSRVVISHVHVKTKADIIFPFFRELLSGDEWRSQLKQQFLKDERNCHSFDITEYTRKPPRF